MLFYQIKSSCSLAKCKAFQSNTNIFTTCYKIIWWSLKIPKEMWTKKKYFKEVSIIFKIENIIVCVT